MPLLLAGLAATAVGTGMTIAGNAQDQSAINDARSQEAMRQQQLQKQATSVFQNSLAQNSAPTTALNINQGASARTALASALKTATQPVVTALPATNANTYAVTGAGGQPVDNSAARANIAGNAWSNVVNSAQNKLGGYGDAFTKQGIANAQAGNRLGVISNKAQGWANILPTEIAAASHSGDPLTGWGQIVSALGSVASLGGASGLGAGFGAARAATAPLDVTSTVPGYLY